MCIQQGSMYHHPHTAHPRRSPYQLCILLAGSSSLVLTSHTSLPGQSASDVHPTGDTSHLLSELQVEPVAQSATENARL